MLENQKKSNSEQRPGTVICQHSLSVRCELTQFLPVVCYEIYCRDCGEVVEKAYTTQQVPPGVRREQMIFTCAKYVGIAKALKWCNSQKWDEFWDPKGDQLAAKIKSAVPQPAPTLMKSDSKVRDKGYWVTHIRDHKDTCHIDKPSDCANYTYLANFYDWQLLEANDIGVGFLISRDFGNTKRQSPILIPYRDIGITQHGTLYVSDNFYDQNISKEGIFL